MGLAPFSGVGFAEVSSIKIAHKNKLTLRDNSGKLAKRQRRVRSMSTADPQCHPHDSSQPGSWRTKRPSDRRWRLSAGISPPPPPGKASNATAVWRQPSPTVRLPEQLDGGGASPLQGRDRPPSWHGSCSREIVAVAREESEILHRTLTCSHIEVGFRHCPVAWDRGASSAILQPPRRRRR
jgi:hypothetical protein